MASGRRGAALVACLPSNVPVLASSPRMMGAEARSIPEVAPNQDQPRKDRSLAPERARVLSVRRRKTADYAATWRLARPRPALLALRPRGCVPQPPLATAQMTARPARHGRHPP